MRHVYSALALTAGLLAVGCEGTRLGFVKNGTQPRLPLEKPTVESLLDSLNRNARQVQSLQCTNVAINYRQGLQSYGVDAMIACQKPRNFRLEAIAFGTTQVDVGSNDREFWYWFAKGDPAYVFRCSHEDLQRGVPLHFPFQPEWILEGLGMGEYGTPEKYRLVEQKESWDLIEQTPNAQGQLVRKVTMFSKSPRIQVRGYRLHDANNKEIYSAQVTKVHNIGGVIVPHVLSFSWPEQKLSMTMTLGRSAQEVILNRTIPPEQSARLFSRPTMKDVPTIDLAEAHRRSAGGIERTGGAIR